MAAAGVVAGLIFVVDSADRQRIKEAQYELENVVTSDEMRDVPVEILANKQDMPGTLVGGRPSFSVVHAPTVGLRLVT